MIMRLLSGAWNVWIEMAPYLLFGFCVAGALSVWLSGAWVRRHLGGGGWRAAARAAALGIPLPLCSCSVIPIAASLRRQGASRGATAAFLMSTPQVGVNSLIVSWGLMG
ncbi:MAG: permease, partial [Kiritimatiellales bacterium]